MYATLKAGVFTAAFIYLVCSGQFAHIHVCLLKSDPSTSVYKHSVYIICNVLTSTTALNLHSVLLMLLYIYYIGDC